jgi:hypothetical protein
MTEERDRRKGPADMTALGDLVSTSLDNGFLGLAKEMVRVFEVWEEAVGPRNAARSRPESIKNHRLTVVVPSSVWIDHFGYFKREFIERINQALGYEAVHEVVFKVGALDWTSERSAAAPAPKPGPTDESGSAEPEVEAEVDDPDLKSRLESWLNRQRSGR